MARDFSGSSEYLLTTSTPVTGHPLTMACWFNPDTVTTAYCLIGIHESSSTSNGFSLRLRGDVSGDPIDGATQTGGSFGTPARTASGFSAGAWQHAAAVFTSTTSVSAFLNGGSKATVNPGLGAPTGLNRIGIGAQGNSTLSLQYDGKLAEPAIWNGDLSDAEIALLAGGVSPRSIRPDALVFYAPLVRDVIAVKGPPLTATGTSVFAHPRIFMPRRRGIITVPGVGGGGGFQAAWARGSNVLLQPGIPG